MFHKYVINCPTCEKEVYPGAVFFSGEGKVRIVGACRPCAKTIMYESTFAEIRFELMLQDDKARRGNGHGEN